MCGKVYKSKKCLLKHEAQHLDDLGLANSEKLGQMGPPLASVEAGQQEDSQYRCRYVYVVRHQIHQNRSSNISELKGAHRHWKKAS